MSDGKQALLVMTAGETCFCDVKHVFCQCPLVAGAEAAWTSGCLQHLLTSCLNKELLDEAFFVVQAYCEAFGQEVA